jgi:hypothetical protein
MARSTSFKYVVALGACILAMLAIVPASFAGEDGDDEDSTPVTHVQSAAGGGGGDTGSASGGVQTGFGGMATAGSGSTLALELAAGGAVLLLTAGGLSVRRRAAERA